MIASAIWSKKGTSKFLQRLGKFKMPFFFFFFFFFNSELYHDYLLMTFMKKIWLEGYQARNLLFLSFKQLLKNPRGFRLTPSSHSHQYVSGI